MTIQTYDGYDPIPVPVNIIYRIFIIPQRLYRKFKNHRRKVLHGDGVGMVHKILCGNSGQKEHMRFVLRFQNSDLRDFGI